MKEYKLSQLFDCLLCTVTLLLSTPNSLAGDRILPTIKMHLVTVGAYLRFYPKYRRYLLILLEVGRMTP